jgi:hypothetical protein
MQVFLTSALAADECQLHALAPLPPRKEPPVPVEEEVTWAPEPVWMTSEHT